MKECPIQQQSFINFVRNSRSNPKPLAKQEMFLTRTILCDSGNMTLNNKWPEEIQNAYGTNEFEKASLISNNSTPDYKMKHGYLKKDEDSFTSLSQEYYILDNSNPVSEILIGCSF